MMHHSFLLDAVSQHQYQLQQRLIRAPRQTQMEPHILCAHSVSISIRLLEACRNGPDVAVPPENVGAVLSTPMVTASCSPSPTRTLCKFQHLMRVRHLTFRSTGSGIHHQFLSSLIPMKRILRPHVRYLMASQNNAASNFLPLFKQIHN